MAIYCKRCVNPRFYIVTNAPGMEMTEEEIHNALRQHSAIVHSEKYDPANIRAGYRWGLA